MKRLLSFALILGILATGLTGVAEEKKGLFGSIGDGLSDAWNWTKGAADDVAGWTSKAANDVADWTTGAANDAWNWTKNTANGTWNDAKDFFNPPEIEDNPNILPEPELPAGTQKMYLGYEVQKTGLNNGYANERSISKNDMHFGMSLGKFYVSGFTSALSTDNESFVFLKTVGDNVELHFELTQDIDMLGGDALVTINADDGGYDRYFGVPSTFFGRGTLIVRHTDYQNNAGEPQIYTDYLTGKMNGTADTVISLNEEGDYEVSLDYEIKRDRGIFGTKMTATDYGNYKIFFKFSVRNGNCMVFPFDLKTGEELKNSAFTENGFYLDLAYSRYLDIQVKRSVLVSTETGMIEDIRFNRPARDGEQYADEGIYTITVKNDYTSEETVKRIYVGTDEQLRNYVEEGFSIDQILDRMN